MESPFYGRIEELDRLRGLLQKKSASLIVIKGRRRIGKSRLIQEFSKDFRTMNFIGLPPEKDVTAQNQREYFAQQLKRFHTSRIHEDDWGEIFWHLAQQTSNGRIVLVLDEINWIGSLDHTFLGKLKSAWDLYFKNNPQLILILSGSMSTWIDDNILSSTGFMGRISLELTLDELPLAVCNAFWRKKASFVSSYEKFKILSVMGGVPRYLEEIDPNQSAEENIFNLAFRKGGLLVHEFDRIFSDLFLKRSNRYKQIVERLADGNATLEQISVELDLEKSGTMSHYLDDLVETGYVMKDHTWNIKNATRSNLCKFRLKDNYLRFYLKYIEPKKVQIEKNLIKTVPAWTTIMGFQFENLVVSNYHKIHEILKLDTHEIVFENPYFQRATQNRPGCQIDFLIQSKFNTLYVCEIKFSKDPLGMNVINEMKDKLERLTKPKHFSTRPILVHVNGVKDSVLESEFFANIIDFGKFLENDSLIL
jgi:hypothetical protein